MRLDPERQNPEGGTRRAHLVRHRVPADRSGFWNDVAGVRQRQWECGRRLQFCSIGFTDGAHAGGVFAIATIVGGLCMSFVGRFRIGRR